MMLSLVLALLCMTLFAFLLLLMKQDLSPRIAFEKILHRLGRRPPKFLPNFHDAPYRRLSGKTSAHRPTLLNIRTSEGTGQACHPDVAYAPEGFGKEGWRYWMACTPYAYCHFAYENPEVFASHDGITWVIPESASNPVVPSPLGPWDHNSDPDLLFVGDELWLYYRESLRSAIPEHRIFLITTKDGISWTKPVELVRENGGSNLLMSPAVVRHGSRFYMFTVGRQNNQLRLARREGVDGLSWSQPVVCSVAGLRERCEVWHLDVIREPGRLSAIIISSENDTHHKLHYGSSFDEGLTWELHGPLLEPAYEFEEGFFYRATLLRKAPERNEYDIWYSAANRRRAFSVAYLRMYRERDQLLPATGGVEENRRPQEAEWAKVAGNG